MPIDASKIDNEYFISLSQRSGVGVRKSKQTQVRCTLCVCRYILPCILAEDLRPLREGPSKPYKIDHGTRLRALLDLLALELQKALLRERKNLWPYWPLLRALVR
jgi:hypothetical protein